MKLKRGRVAGLLIGWTLLLHAETQGPVRSFREGNEAGLENASVKIVCDLAKGTWRAVDRASDRVCVGRAVWKAEGLVSDDLRWTHSASAGEVVNALGRGMVLTVQSRSDGWPDLLMQITLYEDKPFVDLNCGVDNRTGYTVRVREMHPLIGTAFEGADLRSRFFLLDGNGGGQATAVINQRDTLESRNNLLAFFGRPGTHGSLVMGGLTYQDFEKFARVVRAGNALRVDLWSRDPVGKRIDPGVRYFPGDRYYLDFTTRNPFDALEAYGLAVRAAQDVRLPVYYFPTLCLWYSGMPEYGAGPRNNNSPGAVWEMEQALKSGFLNYSQVGIRLVPDNYDKNNQQGWWDNAHWQTLPNTASAIGPCYQPPYETSEKWAQAVTKLGGIPFLYSQTARRSEDYCLAHPDHLLFNDSHQRFNVRPEDCEIWWYGNELPYWGYDFTDPGFVAHMKEVYGNLGRAGVKGMMFDYPSTAWAFEGGMEDPYATAASAYRTVFALARDGLGEGSTIHERNLGRGSDVTLGVVASHRTWGDTDRINPIMASWCGLRWYKNRVVVQYDMDAKNPNHALPDNRDGRRSMLTMASIVAGRFLLGLSFSRMTDEQVFDLTRIFPFHAQPKSARPVDAFSGKRFPQVYDFRINAKWHQLTFYNTAFDSDKWTVEPWRGYRQPLGNPVASRVGVELGGDTAFGGLGLDGEREYYVYDFWNDGLIGRVRGDATISQDLRPGEARMMSVHEAEPNPQFLSTNRHVLQGFMDMPECAWNSGKAELSGVSKVVAGEPYVIVIAGNGLIPAACSAESAKSSIVKKDEKNRLYGLVLESGRNADVRWMVTFKK